MNLRFDITGIPALDLKLQRMTRKVQRKIVQDALRPMARELLGEAQVRVPRRTGALAGSLSQKGFVRRGRMGFRVGTQRWGRGKFYGTFIELGRRRRRIRPTGYLRKPFYGRRDEIVRRARSALIAALRGA